MSYRLAIFDLDGTVLDTIDDLTASVNWALTASSLPTRSREEVLRFVGNGIKRLVELSLPQGEQDAFDRVFADFKVHYALHAADRTKPYAGVCDMLSAQRAAGVRLAVLSNKADGAVQSLVNTYFEGVFHTVMGERENEGVKRKPAPDAVYAILDAHGVTPAEAVYIGDSDVDIMTARNAGLDAILVTWGFRSAAFLREKGAATLVDHPEQLLSLIL